MGKVIQFPLSITALHLLTENERSCLLEILCYSNLLEIIRCKLERCPIHFCVGKRTFVVSSTQELDVLLSEIGISVNRLDPQLA